MLCQDVAWLNDEPAEVQRSQRAISIAQEKQALLFTFHSAFLAMHLKNIFECRSLQH